MSSIDPPPHDESVSHAERERKKNEAQARLVAEGKAIDVKVAFKRCFGEAGEAVTVKLKGY